MEDADGFKKMINDVLETMKREEVIKNAKLNKLIVSAHSGGYRPAAFVLDRGGLNDHITDLFLFDAFYGNHNYFRSFLNASHASIHAAYTDHLKVEHEEFLKETAGTKARQLHFTPTSVDHDEVVQTYFADWIGALGMEWKIK